MQSNELSSSVSAAIILTHGASVPAPLLLSAFFFKQPLSSPTSFQDEMAGQCGDSESAVDCLLETAEETAESEGREHNGRGGVPEGFGTSVLASGCWENTAVRMNKS